ncbi:MAG TPA: hypothetical protein VIM65_17600 [Cyclobacteriaceae bacterium]
MITKEEVLSHWQIQENLLQGYRLIFLTSQTIIISVASLLVAYHETDLLTLIVFSVLLTLALTLLDFWRKIASARALDVSYLQAILFNHEQYESKESLMREFKGWQKLRRNEKEEFIKNHSIEPSATRVTMEKRIPELFFLLWIVLLGVLSYKVFIIYF